MLGRKGLRSGLEALGTAVEAALPKPTWIDRVRIAVQAMTAVTLHGAWETAKGAKAISDDWSASAKKIESDIQDLLRR